MTLEYVIDREGGCVPVRAHTIVLSVQHTKDVSQEQMKKDLFKHVVKVRRKMTLTKCTYISFENLLDQRK